MKRLSALILLSLVSCKSSFQAKQLDGDWAVSKNENVEFSITSDTITYPETNSKFKIIKLKNSLQVLDEGHVVNKFEIIKATTDSLFLKLQNGNIEKYCKISE